MTLQLYMYGLLRRLAFPEQQRSYERAFFKRHSPEVWSLYRLFMRRAFPRQVRDYQLTPNARDARDRWSHSKAGRLFYRNKARRQRAQKQQATVDESAEPILREIRTAPLLPCTYCGAITTPENRHADHIVPLARGGAHSGDNLTSACEQCNAQKGALSFDVWLDRLLGSPAPFPSDTFHTFGADGADRGRYSY